MRNRDAYDLNHTTAPPDTLPLEVINLSKFAVTVDLFTGEHSETAQRPTSLPTRLENRQVLGY